MRFSRACTRVDLCRSFLEQTERAHKNDATPRWVIANMQGTPEPLAQGSLMLNSQHKRESFTPTQPFPLS